MSLLDEPLCSKHIPVKMKTRKVPPTFSGKILAIVIFHSILCGVVYGQLDTDHFYSTRLNIYAQCERLCVASSDCSGADYNYNTRTCYLYTQEMFNMATTSPQGPVVYSTSSKPSVCASVQCRSGEMCVMAGEGSLCLLGTPCGTTAPAGTGTPEGTTAPAVTETPEATTAPEATGTQEGTTAPAATGTQEGTTAPEATGTQEGTTAPAATGTPEGTTAPEATGTQEGTTAPAATGTTGGTTFPQVVSCGPPPEISAMVVSTETTSELVDSTVFYNCALGYMPTSGTGRSMCLDSGTWSTPSLVCNDIPNLIGTAVSSSNTPWLTCITKELTPENSPVTCDPGQVLVHCSVANTSPPFRGGVEIYESEGRIACELKTTNYRRGLVRCCSARGLECEYLHGNVSEPEDDAESALTCYKDFSVLGCSAHVNGSEDTRIDGIIANRTDCIALRGFHQTGNPWPGVTVNGACCRAPGLICDRPQTNNTIGNPSLMCDDGDTMTGCMGYNDLKQIAGSHIEDVGTKITCQVPTLATNYITYAYGVCCRILQLYFSP